MILKVPIKVKIVATNLLHYFVVKILEHAGYKSRACINSGPFWGVLISKSA